MKESSSTTKLRVFFDAGAKITTVMSLNGCLLVEPKVKDDVFHMFTRFGFLKVKMSLDAAKMYRQAELCRKEKDLHKILLRFKPTGPIHTYRITKMTYGVASSSYPPIRSLTRCGNFEATPKPVGEAITRDS